MPVERLGYRISRNVSLGRAGLRLLPFGLLDLLPEPVELGQRGAREQHAPRNRERLQPSKARLELRIRPGEGGDGVAPREPCQVHDGEEEVAHLLLEPLRRLLLERRLHLPQLFSELLQGAPRLLPVEPEGGDPLLDPVGPMEGVEPGGEILEYAALPLPGLDRFPRNGRLRTEECGMASHDFLFKGGYDILRSECPRLLGHDDLEGHVKEEVAELSPERLGTTTVDGIHRLPDLLQEVGDEGASRLVPVPRALFPEESDEDEGAVEYGAARRLEDPTRPEDGGLPAAPAAFGSCAHQGLRDEGVSRVAPVPPRSCLQGGFSHLSPTMSTEPRQRAWVEIRSSTLRRNYERIRKIVGPGPGILPVVKSNGYGLGMRRVVETLEPLEPWGYGIETVEEGRQLRSLGIDRPALVMAPVPPLQVDQAVAAGLTLSISSIEALECVARVARETGSPSRIHVEIDTGMGRAGFDWRCAAEWGAELHSIAGADVEWEGVYTHFYSAADFGSRAMFEQVDRFRAALDVLRPPGPGRWTEHVLNSSGIVRSPELAGDLVRPGIYLYGGRSWPGVPDPDPVLAVRARIVLVRDVPAGTTLGYGATYTSSKRERWATLGIGYGDGIPRALGSGGTVIVGGQRVPMIGRISMGMIVVDITGVPESSARVGEEVTVVGEDGGERITLEEVARVSGSISHEILTRLSTRLPRVWLP